MVSPENDSNAPTEGTDSPLPNQNVSEIIRDAETFRDPGIVREFVQFLREEKKWWLAPILLVTLLLVAVAVLASSPAAPFIYTLF